MQPVTQKKPPQISLRPKFDTPLTMVQALPVTVVGVLLATVAGGTVFYILLALIGLSRFIPAGIIYGLFFVGSLCAIPPLFYEIKKKAYSRTGFLFYDDYLDFQYFQFYLNRRRGRIRYEDIADIVQQASALQEQRGLTTITLFVPSMVFGRREFPGLRIADLPEKAGYTSKILDLLERRMATGAQGAAQAPVVPPSGAETASAAPPGAAVAAGS